MLSILKRFGISTLLCREDESRKSGQFPPSYLFSENDEAKTGTEPIEFDGLWYVKTSLNIEYHDCDSILRELNMLLSNSTENSVISIFTHEKYFCDKLEIIEAVCKKISECDDAKFTF